jgi:transcriptional antiterminator RfaH
MELNPMSYWSVATTKPVREHGAAENLIRQGYEIYLPKYIARIGKEFKVKILFPRYIFVKIVDQWHSINGTFGINRLIITNENKPAVVPDEVIQELKSREDKKGLITLPQSGRFKQGENVKLAEGAFEGYIGLYDGMRDADRARVLIDLLGRKVTVEVSEKALTAVASEGSL